MTASKPGTCQDITVIPDMGADSYGADLEHGVREGEQGEEAGEMRKPFREINEVNLQAPPPFVIEDTFLDNLIEVVDCKAEIKTEEITEPKKIQAFGVPTSNYKLRDIHKCSNCGEEFSDTKGVKRHMRHLNRNLGFKCEGLNCNASYAAAQFVERHMLKAHTKDIEMTTNTKDPGFKKGQQTTFIHCSIGLPPPLSDDAMNTHQCTQCEYKFRSSEELNRHKKVHEGPKHRIFKCPHCNVNYVSKGELNMHKVVHEGQKNGTLECPNCNVKYVKNNALQVHINVNKFHKVNRCGVGQCDVRFMAKCQGKRHMRKEHGMQTKEIEKNQTPKTNKNTMVMEQYKEQEEDDLPPQQQPEMVASWQSAQQHQQQQQQQLQQQEEQQQQQHQQQQQQQHQQQQKPLQQQQQKPQQKRQEQQHQQVETPVHI